MASPLEEAAELVARRMASFLRAPLYSGSPSMVGGSPITIPPKSGATGVQAGQITGLQLQGQTWAVTIHSQYNVATSGGPGGGPFLINARPWIFARVLWTIGVVKHTAEIDLPLSSVTFTLPFDTMQLYVVNQSPDGTDPALEFAPSVGLAVATAWAGRETARARRTITGSADGVGVRFVPPAFSTTMQLTWAGAIAFDLTAEFLDIAGNVLATTSLSPGPPAQQALPIDIPHGTVQVLVKSGGNAQGFAAIFTLSL